MKIRGKYGKTGAISFEKGKINQEYSYIKRNINLLNPGKVIEEYINALFCFLWTIICSVKDMLLMYRDDIKKVLYRNMLKMNLAEKPNNLNKINENTKTKPSLSRKNAGNNWQNAQTTVSAHAKPGKKGCITKYIAIDCEMVGIGRYGQNDMLARVSLVNQKGEVLLDKFVKPIEPVTDYRTEVSGIRPHDIQNAENFLKVQHEVLKIIEGNILVGHSIAKDLSVLRIKHPHKNIRDTAKYRPLAKLVSRGGTPSLRTLSKSILGLDIQNGEHDSTEDARATMAIYNRVSAEWEKHIKRREQRHKSNHHKHGHGHGRKT
ncbi:uncharacterized protein LOC129606605 [Condylostylus longicornis]|uniref:uncharacterized protein LOC129606605 n=1 Tax=Condylostylus longicornis TaxID=2530218 RepID=UPI00244E0893|nr:uncharacterized protein LOC129606605 [Condylostylus longicornis]